MNEFLVSFGTENQEVQVLIGKAGKGEDKLLGWEERKKKEQERGRKAPSGSSPLGTCWEVERQNHAAEASRKEQRRIVRRFELFYGEKICFCGFEFGSRHLFSLSKVEKPEIMLEILNFGSF